MLFFLKRWPDFPPDFHQIPYIYRTYRQPGAQQCNIWASHAECDVRRKWPPREYVLSGCNVQEWQTCPESSISDRTVGVCRISRNPWCFPEESPWLNLSGSTEMGMGEGRMTRWKLWGGGGDSCGTTHLCPYSLDIGSDLSNTNEGHIYPVCLSVTLGHSYSGTHWAV